METDGSEITEEPTYTGWNGTAWNFGGYDDHP